jgi:hypothetical protein
MRATRTPLPHVPRPEMVRCPTIHPFRRPLNNNKQRDNDGAPGVPARQAADISPPGQEKFLVRAEPAQRQRSPPPTPEKILAHARNVGAALIVQGSASVARFSLLAHVSPLHHGYRLHCSRLSKLAVPTPPLPVTFAAKGKWIAIDRIQQMPITGLTRKILKAAGII